MTGYSVDAMMDEEAVLNTVVALQDGGFCEAVAADDVENCNTALEIVIPTGLNAIAMADRSWVADFCAGRDCV